MVKKMTAGLAACALGAAVGFAAWQLPAAFSRQASAACAAGAGQTAAEGDGLSAACADVGGAQAASLRLPAGSEQACIAYGDYYTTEDGEEGVGDYYFVFFPLASAL